MLACVFIIKETMITIATVVWHYLFVIRMLTLLSCLSISNRPYRRFLKTIASTANALK